VRQNGELMKSWFSGHTNVEIREAFDQIDADHSGDITWDEFEKYAAS
jgi:Ca2+-binding EF-hand superfamily protein